VTIEPQIARAWNQVLPTLLAFTNVQTLTHAWKQTAAARLGLCPECSLVLKSERWFASGGQRLTAAPPALGGLDWTLRTNFSTCPSQFSNASLGRGVEVSETRVEWNSTHSVYHRLEFVAYGTVCCGVRGLWGSARQVQKYTYCRSCWYKSANTDRLAASGGLRARSPGAKVHILTQLRVQKCKY